VSLRDTIAAVPFFQGLPDAHLDALAGCAREARFADGEALLREGEGADQFYLLREGIVRLVMHWPHRGELTLETLGTGEVLGWSWIAPPYRWHFDAIARGGVRAIAFDARCLRGEMTSDPAFGYEMMSRFAAVISHRLQAARMQMMDVYAPPGGEEAP